MGVSQILVKTRVWKQCPQMLGNEARENVKSTPFYPYTGDPFDQKESIPIPGNAEDKREAVRQVCAKGYLEGYSDTKVFDPINDIFPSCFMPLSCAVLTVKHAIMHSKEYAKEYLTHVSLVREVLEQSPVSLDPALLASSGNKLLQSLSVLLAHSTNFLLIKEPILVWSIVRTIRLRDRSDAVFQQVRRSELSMENPICMPCAPMPLSQDKAPSLILHPTGFQPFFYTRGLVLHLTKKGTFWRSQPPSVNQAILQFRRLTDRDAYAELKKLEIVDCGYTPPIPRCHHYDHVTGMHKSLGRGCSLRDDQYWIKHPRNCTLDPFWFISGLTQQLEQLSMKKPSNTSEIRASCLCKQHGSFAEF